MSSNAPQRVDAAPARAPTHLDENDVVDLLADLAPPPRWATLAIHLTRCPACRELVNVCLTCRAMRDAA